MTAPSTIALPSDTHPFVDPKSGTITPEWYKYMVALDRAARALVGGSASALTSDGGAVLTGGFTEAPFDLGTPANGVTVTPNPSDNLKQKLVNNVAGFTIAATAEVGDVELFVSNGANAGTITFSGFSKQWSGDSLDTTNGHAFVVFIYGLPNGASAYLIKALQ